MFFELILLFYLRPCPSTSFYLPIHANGVPAYHIPSGYTTSQLRLRIDQLFHLGKLVVVLQALRVKQRPAGLDDLTRDDLLNRQLDLLEIDGCLALC